mmetsp:Transcript_13485/g.43063  ORF Transcript_13485/g.43063 Transcript_13485/m.43063 type:complete len:248 (+) Transcript_13485:300-1043(+)
MARRSSAVIPLKWSTRMRCAPNAEARCDGSSFSHGSSSRVRWCCDSSRASCRARRSSRARRSAASVSFVNRTLRARSRSSSARCSSSTLRCSSKRARCSAYSRSSAASFALATSRSRICCAAHRRCCSAWSLRRSGAAGSSPSNTCIEEGPSRGSTSPSRPPCRSVLCKWASLRRETSACSRQVANSCCRSRWRAASCSVSRWRRWSIARSCSAAQRRSASFSASSRARFSAICASIVSRSIPYMRS